MNGASRESCRDVSNLFESDPSDRTDGQTREPSETAGSKKEARVTVNLAMVIVLNRKITHDLDVQNERPRRQGGTQRRLYNGEGDGLRPVIFRITVIKNGSGRPGQAGSDSHL